MAKTLKLGTRTKTVPLKRTATLWVVLCVDQMERGIDGASVYVFPEGYTEKQVLADLWQEWVVEPYMSDKNEGYDVAEPKGPPSWDGLAEHAGDWSFEPEQRKIEVFR